MSVAAILLPMFVQVALTFVLLMRMGTMRFASIRAGNTKTQDIALGQSNWPPRVQQASNCVNNQFQLPVLFYVLVVLALFLHKADLLFGALALLVMWAIFAIRILFGL
jgi:hypothetical protein